MCQRGFFEISDMILCAVLGGWKMGDNHLCVLLRVISEKHLSCGGGALSLADITSSNTSWRTKCHTRSWDDGFGKLLGL